MNIILHGFTNWLKIWDATSFMPPLQWQRPEIYLNRMPITSRFSKNITMQPAEVLLTMYWKSESGWRCHVPVAKFSPWGWPNVTRSPSFRTAFAGQHNTIFTGINSSACYTGILHNCKKVSLTVIYAEKMWLLFITKYRYNTRGWLVRIYRHFQRNLGYITLYSYN